MPWRLLPVALLTGTAVATLHLNVGVTGAFFTSGAAAQFTMTSSTGCGFGSAYQQAVAASTPALSWGFGDAVGATEVADSSGNNDRGSVRTDGPESGITLGTAPALVLCDSTALDVRGGATDTGYIVSTVRSPAPTTFSFAFVLSAAAGSAGRIFGFGDAATGPSTVTDRVALLDATGHLCVEFATTTGRSRDCTTDAVVDGTSHHIVVSVAATALSIYVDGLPSASAVLDLAPGYDGYWRVGWDQTTDATLPTAGQAAAVIDELAVWPFALSAPEVAALRAADRP